MKSLAFAIVSVGPPLGCAELPKTNDPPIRAAAPSNNPPAKSPGVEAPNVPSTTSMSPNPGTAFPNDRDPPERISGSR